MITSRVWQIVEKLLILVCVTLTNEPPRRLSTLKFSENLSFLFALII